MKVLISLFTFVLMFYCYAVAADVRVFEYTGENELSKKFRLNPNIIAELDNLEEELNEARKTWESNRIDDYILKIQDRCFGSCGTHTLTIRGSEIIDAVSETLRPGAENWGDNTTIPFLFRLVEHYIDEIKEQVERWSNADKPLKEKIVKGEAPNYLLILIKHITVTFNEKYGYPNHIAIKMFAEDMDYEVTVKDLRILTEESNGQDSFH